MHRSGLKLNVAGVVGMLATLSGAARSETIAFAGFDTGLEGWTVSDTSGATWEPTGGNPGGYLRNVDLRPTVTRAFSPFEPPFLGDYTPLEGSAVIRFDFALFATGNFGPGNSVPSILLEGDDGSAFWEPEPLATVVPFGWRTFEAPLTEDQWTVTDGTWDALLANVQSFRITMDILETIGQAGEVTGLDNVRIETVTNPAGDYNASGQVEQGDLDLVLQNWGVNTVTTGIPAGWTNDLPSGQIEQTELDGILQNWGSTATPDFGGSNVPEPAGVAMLVLGLTATRKRHRVA